MPDSHGKCAPGTFAFIEQQIRQDAIGTEFGSDFEWLCRYFLLAAPQYKGLFESVWLWNDWPGRWGADKGIDLVALTVAGDLWAIQAKAVRSDRAIPKSELDSFLSESNRLQFNYRLIMATTDDIGHNARDTLNGQEKPVGLVLRGELLSAEVRWPTLIGEESASLPRNTPRPHQTAAIEDVSKGFLDHDRGQLIMACGTGKTLTALWIAEKLASRCTLVLVPSLSLVTQTLIAWGRSCAKAFDYLVVCSDETVVQRSDDAAVTSTNELGVPVTTDVGTIQQFLGRTRNRPAVVFATYQSSDRVAAAQAAPSPDFDLVIADEAHRCTGPADGLFTTVLDAAKIKARRRLFMTATPRYFTGRVKQRAEELEYELASMDDEARFGPVFHRLAFDAAIRADLLTDYQVVVIGVTQADLRRWAEEGRFVRTKDGMQTDARTLAAQIGLAKAMRQYDLGKIITFHSSVAKARRFTDAAVAESLVGVMQRMSLDAQPSGQLWTGHISGQTPAGKRSTLLTVFGNLPDGSRGVLSNCACLGEGVDVPVLDGVAFIDPKRSMIDIIQAVGRVIRKADDKRIGTVVIPVFVDESEDAGHALSQSAFEPVWQVLKALRAHDQKLADELDDLRFKLGERCRGGGKIRLPEKIKVDVPALILEEFEQAFFVRTVERTTDKPRLNIEQILAWADEHQAAIGDWPKMNSGEVFGTDETWAGIDYSLRAGRRSLPGNSSLATVLAKYRGVRNLSDLQNLTIEQIVVWADAYKAATGEWPTRESGETTGTDESWARIDNALKRGARALPRGSSLAKVLALHRGVRNLKDLPILTIEQILGWIDDYKDKTGEWPTRESGQIIGADETWAAVSTALVEGLRGLSGGSSLTKLLAEQRGLRNMGDLPYLTIDQILGWADSLNAVTGEWPTMNSGPVAGTNEMWTGIDRALRRGLRGLTRGSSLAKLLDKHRGLRNPKDLPPLTIEQILGWVDEYNAALAGWPTPKSGQITGTDETWAKISTALVEGLRGLPKGSSLPKLLAEHHGVRNKQDVLPLAIEQILGWVDAHKAATGNWPNTKSGRVTGTDETWSGIQGALFQGGRGLRGGSTLAKLLAEHRGVRNTKGLAKLTIAEILAWADAHNVATGKWPGKETGQVKSTHETWSGINIALCRGGRGLPGGSSLAQLLADHRGKPNPTGQ